jgi:hypothetical protein
MLCQTALHLLDNIDLRLGLPVSSVFYGNDPALLKALAGDIVTIHPSLFGLAWDSGLLEVTERGTVCLRR